MQLLETRTDCGGGILAVLAVVLVGVLLLWLMKMESYVRRSLGCRGGSSLFVRIASQEVISCVRSSQKIRCYP